VPSSSPLARHLVEWNHTNIAATPYRHGLSFPLKSTFPFPPPFFLRRPPQGLSRLALLVPTLFGRVCVITNRFPRSLLACTLCAPFALAWNFLIFCLPPRAPERKVFPPFLFRPLARSLNISKDFPTRTAAPLFFLKSRFLFTETASSSPPLKYPLERSVKGERFAFPQFDPQEKNFQGSLPRRPPHPPPPLFALSWSLENFTYPLMSADYCYSLIYRAITLSLSLNSFRYIPLSVNTMISLLPSRSTVVRNRFPVIPLTLSRFLLHLSP